MKKEVFVECGCCGHYHRENFWGDCRNDEERFVFEEVPNGVKIISLEEQMEKIK